MLSHSEVVAKTLAEQGVRYMFGLPGGEISSLIEACRSAEIRVLLTGHESSAALIAQVMGQITGLPGVCFATVGPGATNLMTGVANAFLDRSPLVAFVAQTPQGSYESMTHQRVAIESLFAPVTKRTTVVGTTDTCELVRNSFSLAIAPRPGPVMLVLPSDVANQAAVCSRGETVPSEKSGNKPKASSLAKVRDRIALSSRPLIVVGLGAPAAGATHIRELVEKLEAPFLVTPKVKGILPEDHPLFVGVASGMAIDQDILATVRAADLILGIGFDPVEVDKTWFTEVEVVAIDTVSMAAGAYHPAEAIGDLVSLVAQLTNTITEPRPWPTKLLEERRQALVRSPKRAHKGVSPLGLIEGLRQVFPRSGVVSCDVGAHKALLGQFWRSYMPGTFFMSNGLSGMGYGIPAGIAAQLAYPDRAVMSIVGDGGMLMMVHDLVLIRELALPLIIVVLTDNSLSLIRIAQERRGYPPCGVDFNAPNFAAVGQAFGLPGKRANSISDAKSAVEHALEHRTTLLLEVPVDPREYYDLA